jgi:hypothetical protein
MATVVVIAILMVTALATGMEAIMLLATVVVTAIVVDIEGVKGAAWVMVMVTTMAMVIDMTIINTQKHYYENL